MEVLNANKESKKYRKARKRVKEIKGFYIHLMVYLMACVFFVAVNLLKSPNDIWFYWPIIGWGFGVFFHGFGVFGGNVIFGKEWEERKIREYLEKEERVV